MLISTIVRRATTLVAVSTMPHKPPTHCRMTDRQRVPPNRATDRRHSSMSASWYFVSLSVSPSVVSLSVSQAGSQPASQLAICSTLAGAGIWHMLHATCTRSAIKYCTPRQCFQHCYSNNNNTTKNNKNNTNKRNRSIAGMFHGQKYAAAVVVFVVVLSLIQLASTQRASA